MRASAVCRVDEAEAVEAAVVDGALRDLVGGGPAAVVAHQCDGKSGVLVATRPAQHAVELALVFGQLPRSVVAVVFESREQFAAQGAEGAAGYGAQVPIFAA